MDEGDPQLEKDIRSVLDIETKKKGLEYHELKYRSTGISLWVEFHLLFPEDSPLRDAHWAATEIEAALQEVLPHPSTIISHLEPVAEHDATHRDLRAEHR